MRILHWFRKDLRLDDNTALHAVTREADGNVVPFYTSEPSLLARPDIAPIRVRFVLDALADLDRACRRAGSRLALAHGEAVDTVIAAARGAGADTVSWNDEYEPALVARDAAVEKALRDAGLGVRRFQDRQLVPPDAVLTREGKPYTVYSAYRRACEALPVPLPSPFPAVTRLAAHDLPERPLASPERLGFAAPPDPAAELWPGGATAGRTRLRTFLGKALSRYAAERDFPAAQANSRLSADLKFGTLGVRRIVQQVREAGADASSDKFVAELRWRDFFAQVLFHHPHVEHGAYRREFDAIEWEGREEWFAAWCEGRTGYPIVDAGMRELAATGFMHNRVRMIVASFLTKDLLLDWRRGERWFMRNLVDGDLANNNGGWQWAAGTGTDAQPWFGIFNPSLQAAKFDPAGAYVTRWAPGTTPPIVVHEERRDPALALYARTTRRSGE